MRGKVVCVVLQDESLLERRLIFISHTFCGWVHAVIGEEVS